MQVRANVHAHRAVPTVGRFDPENLSILRNVVAVGTQRERRDLRHAVIRRTLGDLRTLDAIIPGLSEVEPGIANDMLRTYRGSVRQMGSTPVELQAALVAARILCWMKLHR